ncbi:hypothetical protein CAC42_1839 [Sphaceloma murrayae]|uniref:Uncharacterized protein n=1 Tax=Sphaceloma murrayae TaxID=2082308 RepID=A0A2K1QW33_9PEZI|nr:hypothetical protein CAC42_1839 [Sphaceloma murrayae]
MFLRSRGYLDIVAVTLHIKAPESYMIEKKRFDFKGYSQCFECEDARTYDKTMGAHLGKCKAVKRYLASTADTQHGSYLYTAGNPSSAQSHDGQHLAQSPRPVNPNGPPIVHNPPATGRSAASDTDLLSSQFFPYFIADIDAALDMQGGMMTMLDNGWPPNQR